MPQEPDCWIVVSGYQPAIQTNKQTESDNWYSGAAAAHTAVKQTTVCLKSLKCPLKGKTKGFILWWLWLGLKMDICSSNNILYPYLSSKCTVPLTIHKILLIHRKLFPVKMCCHAQTIEQTGLPWPGIPPTYSDPAGESLKGIIPMG